MKKLAATLLTLTAIGVAVKVGKEKNLIVTRLENVEENISVLANKISF